jgi:hypothetical protein
MVIAELAEQGWDRPTTDYNVQRKLSTAEVEGTDRDPDPICITVSRPGSFCNPQSSPGTELWRALNQERWKLDLEVCYCSLLENCYITEKPGQVQSVSQCPASR